MTEEQRARARYREQKATARQRGVEFLLTFEEWWAWWQVDDRWAKRGRGGLVMARTGDVGPYALWNIRAATTLENVTESVQVRKEMDPDRYARAAAKRAAKLEAKKAAPATDVAVVPDKPVSEMTFGEMLKAAGYERPWLAARTGRSLGAVSRWCDGTAEAPAAVLAWLERRVADPPPKLGAYVPVPPRWPAG